jgi:hypothetical protein
MRRLLLSETNQVQIEHESGSDADFGLKRHTSLDGVHLTKNNERRKCVDIYLAIRSEQLVDSAYSHTLMRCAYPYRALKGDEIGNMRWTLEEAFYE